MELNNVKFSSKSMIDDFGRVFFYENKVYRAIQPDKENYCNHLIKSDLFKELESNGFIPKTIVSKLKLEGYNLILEHEKLLEIQQHEWSYEMFKNAALMVISVNKICNKHGYELKDAHTFNILFRGTKPVWVDIGSISKTTNTNNWIAYDEFISVFFVPIQFYLQKDYYIVRKLLESNFYRMQTAPFQTFWESGLKDLLLVKPYYFNLCFRKKILKRTSEFDVNLNKLIRRFNKYYHKLFRKPVMLFSYQKITKSIDEIEDYIKNCNPEITDSQWNNYHKQNYQVNGEIIVSYRFNRLIELINEFCENADTAVDLAGNEGFFTNLMQEKTTLKKIILTDYDTNAVDTAYKFFQNQSRNSTSVALLNFMFTPGINETIYRFKSDISIALAVTHHLILTQQFSIQTIFERLADFSNNYVVVEFMPLGLWSIHTRSGIEMPDWYNQEWFESNFTKYFILLHFEQLEENRIVYIGKKKV